MQPDLNGNLHGCFFQQSFQFQQIIFVFSINLNTGEMLAVNHDQMPSHDIQDTGNHLAAENSARNLNFSLGIFQRIIIAVRDTFNDFYHKYHLNPI